jgi:hypothetical protein
MSVYGHLARVTTALPTCNAQSSRFTFPLDDPTLEWCLSGELGLEDDNPALLRPSCGPPGNSRRGTLSSLGVYPLSIVVFS